ncbi:40s ribosomal protein s6-b [Mycena albidolilacea]|uniref:40s ribosomal protein s6-b n=1 Tax=Mycena albidolilacea TaxID=1033008 RepID=A0AAD7EZ59_9AGAR|nr:40s ribosomal protein s6-b [Mycena albidolilacea]
MAGCLPVDRHRHPVFYDKKITQEVPTDTLVSEWAGYILRITGGNDEQGFPMKQGVLLPYRIKLLLSDSHSCYRPCRTGERKRKFVRVHLLSVVLVKQDEGEIVGLTDDVLPKRVNKIQCFFNLSKEDVGKYVVRRDPKIQCPVTPIRLQRPRHLKSLVCRRSEHQKEQKAEFDSDTLKAENLKMRIQKALYEKAR